MKMTVEKKASLLMMLSALMFACMQIFIAKTADTIPLFEQVFFRNIISAIIAFFYIKKQRRAFITDKKNIPLLCFRSVAGYLGVITLFYASAYANQGDVATITKMSPFVTVVLAWIFLKEKITGTQIIALFFASTGAVFVSAPTFNSDFLPICSALLSAIFAGIAYTIISLLKGKEDAWGIIFFFSALSTIFSIPLMLHNFVLPTLRDFIFLLCIGGFALGGQVFLTHAYSSAKASYVSVFNYTGIVFSMILGYIFLGQQVALFSVLGSLLVVVAGIIMYAVHNNDNSLREP